MTLPTIRSPDPRARELSFEQTVPRALAHRRAISEVFVSDSARVADDEFVAALQVPRAHSLWHDHSHALHDPLLVVEACRQAAFVGTHRYLGVPIGTRGSLQSIEYRVDELDAYRDDGANPLESIARIRVADRQDRQGALTAMRFEARLTIGERPAMTMSGTILFIPADDFAVLRAHQRAAKPLLDRAPAAPARIDPVLVGRCDVRNMAIGDVDPDAPASGEQRFPVVVEPANPAFFDHEQDHLPGPLIVEVYRQAAVRAAVRAGALATPVAVATGLRATFSDFGEYEGATECAALVGPVAGGDVVTVRLGLHQFGARLAEAELDLTPLSESRARHPDVRRGVPWEPCN